LSDLVCKNLRLEARISLREATGPLNLVEYRQKGSRTKRPELFARKLHTPFISLIFVIKIRAS